MKRILSFILTLAVLTAFPIIASAAEEYKLFPEGLAAHADNIAKVAAEHGEGYSFGNTGVTIDEARQIMTIMLNDYPELVHLDTSYSYSYYTDVNTGDTIVTKIFLRYRMTPDEYAAAKAELKAWAKNVIALADSGFTPLEYVLFFHDYIAANYEYDTDITIYDAYTMIKSGKGVCQAYSHAYAYLLESVGIDVSFATSHEMNHLWSIVKLDGSWYHVDVTWDDPIGNQPGSANHEYFLKSDVAFASEAGEHHDWISRYACSSNKYDSHWLSQIDGTLAYAKGSWYTVTDNGRLCATNSLDKNLAIIRQFDNMLWQIPSGNGHYVGVFSSVMSFKNKVYFNTPTELICYNPADNSYTTLYTYTGAGGYIYGFSESKGADGYSDIGGNNGELIIAIGETPSKIVETKKYAAVFATVIKGDADGNGKVNISDVSLLLKYLADWDVTFVKDGADADGNGRVNISDVSVILKTIAGWYE